MKKGIMVTMGTAADNDEKVLTLRLGTNAIAMLEERLKCPITKMDSILEKIGIIQLRDIYFCALYWEKPDRTLAQVGDIMDEIIETHGIEYLSAKATEALVLAFPEKKKAPAKKQ